MTSFSTILLHWYDENKRELPWRRQSDPYIIWISEIILQQTRVSQGYDYFLRFIERFPDVETLARATEEEVMKMWQGLGYYSRARNLHAAAVSIVEAAGREGRLVTFPSTYEEIRALKGVGDYTAAAICSFAYGLPHAVVDGNVYRVLSRYFGVDQPIDSPQGKKYFAALAAELLPARRSADYNQAVMDFGALQCTPQSPACLLCPLQESCVALARGIVTQLPVKHQRTAVLPRYFNYIYIGATGLSGNCEVLLHKRAAGDIWQGLYELPLVEADHDLTPEELFASDGFQQLVQDIEEPLKLRPLQCGVKHVLTHRIIYANFYELLLSAEALNRCAGKPLGQFTRVKHEEVENYAVPRLIHAFLEKYK